MKDEIQRDRKIVQMMVLKLFSGKKNKRFADKFYALMDGFKVTKEKGEFEFLAGILEDQLNIDLKQQIEKVEKLLKKTNEGKTDITSSPAYKEILISILLDLQNSYNETLKNN